MNLFRVDKNFLCIKKHYKRISRPLIGLLMLNICLFIYVFFKTINHQTLVLEKNILSLAFDIFLSSILLLGVGVILPVYYYLNRYNVNFVTSARKKTEPSSGVGATITAYTLTLMWPIIMFYKFIQGLIINCN